MTPDPQPFPARDKPKALEADAASILRKVHEVVDGDLEIDLAVQFAQAMATLALSIQVGRLNEQLEALTVDFGEGPGLRVSLDVK